MVTPDNCVIKRNYEEPLLNESYRELVDYYQMVIVPVRVRKTKDKPSVEGVISFISRQILASLRNIQCFYLKELNELVWEINNHS